MERYRSGGADFAGPVRARTAGAESPLLRSAVVRRATGGAPALQHLAAGEFGVAGVTAATGGRPGPAPALAARGHPVCGYQRAGAGDSARTRRKRHVGAGVV